MPRRRFLISTDRIQDGIAVLDPDQAHHLRDVLRLGSGDEIELFDGRGCVYWGRIEACGAEVRVRLNQTNVPPRNAGATLVLGAALIKQDRFEWLLQKSTELGVHRIIPLLTRFTSVNAANLESRMKRWRRIAQEAAKQCRRLTVPEVMFPMPFAALLSAPEIQGHLRFLLHNQAEEPLHLVRGPDLSVLLCIGPEGGWEAAETRAAKEAGFRLVRMGPRILRTETAALAALAVLQFLLDE